jgi:tetratricopeptide (TPR) repeat protein
MLAYHYGRAGVVEKAISYLELAGDRARDRYANAEAVAYYRELVAHLGGLERTEDTARACEKLGIALAAVPAYDEALTMFERAAEAYRSAEDAKGQRLAAARIGELQARRGRSADGLARLQPVLASTSGSDAHALSRGLAALYLSLAHLHFVGGAYREQLDAATRAAELAQEAGDDDVLRMAEYRRAIAMVALGQVDEGYRMMVEHVIPLAEATGDLHTLVRALTQVGAMCGAYWAEFAQERQYIERAMIVAERMAEPIDIAFLTYRRGHNAFSIGKWAQARSDFERAVALMRQVDKSWFSTYPPVGLGLLRLAQGDRAAAMQALDEAVALAERICDLQALSWVHVRQSGAKAPAGGDARLGAPDRLFERHRRADLWRLRCAADHPDSQPAFVWSQAGNISIRGPGAVGLHPSE